MVEGVTTWDNVKAALGFGIAFWILFYVVLKGAAFLFGWQRIEWPWAVPLFFSIIVFSGYLAIAAYSDRNGFTGVMATDGAGSPPMFPQNSKDWVLTVAGFGVSIGFVRVVRKFLRSTLAQAGVLAAGVTLLGMMA